MVLVSRYFLVCIEENREVWWGWGGGLVTLAWFHRHWVEVIHYTYPLCVTSVCRSPSFLNKSTTVSIGVASVIWIGLYHDKDK